MSFQEPTGRALIDKLEGDEFAEFFRGLGYEVTWDFSRRERVKWYEIYDEGRLICQVDWGTPLAVFLKDLPAFALGKAVVEGSPDYNVRCEDDAALKKLAARVAQAEKCTCPAGDPKMRSTHCPHHGSCTCCHGATCPMHDEPERLVPVREGA